MIKINSGYLCHRKYMAITALILLLSFSSPLGFLNNSYATPLFGTSVPLSADFGSSSPQIASDGTDVYVVWQNAAGNISFIPIVGGVPGTEIELSSDFGSSSPQIASDGTDVFVVWQNAAGNISFIPIVGGVPGVELELSSDNAFASPQIASDGTDVFVVWQNAAGNISFIPIVGGVPGVELELSSDNAFTSPQIAASGSNAYVVWLNAAGNIAFTRIVSGVADAPTELDTTGGAFAPQIAASGTDTYVSWLDSSLGNFEIFFMAITASGTGFANPVINLSGTSGNSFFPEVAAFGSDVYVTWRDLTFSSGGLDVLFKASSDNGGIFGGLKKLNTGGITIGQQIVATATSSNVVWYQSDSGNTDIFFATGAVSDIDINFDFSEYLTSGTTVITVTDPSKAGDGSIEANLKSTTTSGGITLTLDEDDANPGIFTGSAILTTDDPVAINEIKVS